MKCKAKLKLQLTPNAANLALALNFGKWLNTYYFFFNFNLIFEFFNRMNNIVAQLLSEQLVLSSRTFEPPMAAYGFVHEITLVRIKLGMKMIVGGGSVSLLMLHRAKQFNFNLIFEFL